MVLAIGVASISSTVARDSFNIGINVGGYGYPQAQYYAGPPVVYYNAPPARLLPFSASCFVWLSELWTP